jgi:hypothetical protein
MSKSLLAPPSAQMLYFAFDQTRSNFGVKLKGQFRIIRMDCVAASSVIFNEGVYSIAISVTLRLVVHWVGLQILRGHER